ncbi:MAG TPA: AMP-binding protein [Chryseosolibacter sp.]
MKSILDSSEPARTAFEDSTFAFIRAWFSPEQSFEISTSGSTGAPKKIIVTRDQMIASASATAHALRLQKGNSCLICIDTKYIGGRMMLVRAFTTGLQIYAVDPSANPFEKLPPGQCVNFAAFVPYQVEHILASSNPSLLLRVEKAIIGGAPINQHTVDALGQFTTDFYATYGMTETISHVALQKLNGAAKQDFFETLPGITVALDERECITLDVPYLREKIITNDLAHLLSPTRFRWTGRFDNIINTGGIKVSPERIEAVVQKFLTSSGHSYRFFVHGVEDRLLGTRVVLVIEANILDEQFLKSLHSSLAAALPPYEIPKEALLVSKFSESGNGKINRLQTVKGFHATVSVK